MAREKDNTTLAMLTLERFAESNDDRLRSFVGRMTK